MKRTLACLPLCCALLFADHNELFYVPENLKANVAFWETIYRNVPGDRGLLHDMDSILVIYDTLITGDRKGRTRSRFVSQHVNSITEKFKTMAWTDRSGWDSSMLKLEAAWGRELSAEELERAADKVRFQLGQRDNFIRGIERSGRYMDTIRVIFTENGLPVELSYLPHVESSFNYRAYSKAGAAGIWQFMRSTGRLYMKVGYVIDERLDPIKSSHAAMKLLRNNYRRLKSWPLALTGYNHGAAGMERAVKECGTTDIGVIVDNYRSRRFRFASKNFYSSFVAACRTASDHETYYGPVTLEPPFHYHEHVLDKYYRPTVLARTLGVSFEELRDYNLAVRPSVFKSDQHLPKGYHLKLPASFAGVNVDSIIRAIPDRFVRDTLPPAAYHKVNSGENLWIISQRYGISLNTLFRLNNLDQNACIYPGQMIALPGGKALPPTEVAVAAADKAPAKTGSPAPAGPDRGTPEAGILPGYLYAAPSPEQPLHVVEPVSADSLWAFMVPALTALTLFGVRECEFCEFNADYYRMDFVEQTDDEVTLVVQINETLGHYADWAGIVSSRIRVLNNISANISMGQKVRVPLPRGRAADFLKKRIEHHMGIEEDFFNNYTVVAMDTTQVKQGTTLWSVCRDNDIPFWLFMKANHLGPDLKLDLKDRILLPVIEDKNF